MEPRTSSSADGNSEFIGFYLQSILKKLQTNKTEAERIGFRNQNCCSAQGNDLEAKMFFFCYNADKL